MVELREVKLSLPQRLEEEEGGGEEEEDDTGTWRAAFSSKGKFFCYQMFTTVQRSEVVCVCVCLQ